MHFPKSGPLRGYKAAPLYGGIADHFAAAARIWWQSLVILGIPQYGYFNTNKAMLYYPKDTNIENPVA